MEGKNKTYLIIPDVHGRDFWKEGVKKRLSDEKIIFLGDYTDPYSFEGITHEVVPGTIREILETPNAIFLLGNHDLSYLFPNSPEVRQDKDIKRFKEIENLFLDNWDKFRLTYTEDELVFSHAGFLKSMYNRWRNKKYTIKTIADLFQNRWEEKDINLLGAELFYISGLRGGWSKFGSFVWADVREHLREDHLFWSKHFQVFGHTMLKTGHIIRRPTFAMVDCQRPVRLITAKRWKDYRFEIL